MITLSNDRLGICQIFFTQHLTGQARVNYPVDPQSVLSEVQHATG